MIDPTRCSSPSNAFFTLFQSEYRKRGFQEVVTPNIYNSKLWQTSGHWQHYSENMFSFEVEKEIFALKPMNCPGHWYVMCTHAWVRIHATSTKTDQYCSLWKKEVSRDCFSVFLSVAEVGFGS